MYSIIWVNKINEIIGYPSEVSLIDHYAPLLELWKRSQGRQDVFVEFAFIKIIGLRPFS